MVTKNGASRKARLLASLVLLLVASTTLFWRIRVDTPSGAGARQLSTCSRISDGAMREDCLRVSLAAIVTTDGPGVAASTLRTLLETEPPSSDLHRLCHTAAHAAGSEHPVDRAALETFLLSADAGVCEWGITHGLLAALVAAGPSGSDLASLLETCAALDAEPERLGCGDSVGHAIWELEGEFLPAVDRCFAANASSVPASATAVSEACLSGVFMQFYRPVAPSSKDGEWYAPISDSDAIALCLALPPGREPACAEAAHYVFSDELKRLRTDAVDGTVDAEEGFPVLFEQALLFCGQFSEAGSRRCSDASARYFLQALRGLPGVDPRVAVCSVLPTQRQQRCLDAASALHIPS